MHGHMKWGVYFYTVMKNFAHLIFDTTMRTKNFNDENFPNYGTCILILWLTFGGEAGMRNWHHCRNHLHPRLLLLLLLPNWTSLAGPWGCLLHSDWSPVKRRPFSFGRPPDEGCGWERGWNQPAESVCVYVEGGCMCMYKVCHEKWTYIFMYSVHVYERQEKNLWIILSPDAAGY